MKAVIQRVTEASVTVEGVTVGSIGPGLLVLYCAEPDDTEAMLQWLASKLAGLRIFSDEQGKMNLSVKDVGGSILLVSQFTLAGRLDKGMRPSFIGAAAPDKAKADYERLAELLRRQELTVEMGIFAADMKVSLVNDGPVTIIID